MIALLFLWAVVLAFLWLVTIVSLALVFGWLLYKNW